MSAESVYFLLPIAILLAIALIRLTAGSMDRDRVRRYLSSKGSRVTSIRWRPFGRGWFGEKGDRIYEVRYLEANGNEHLGYCKTSMWSGVYLAEDQVVGRVPLLAAEDDALRLAEENQRLREELERLKKGEA